LIKTNGIKRREFLIRVRPKRVAFLIARVAEEVFGEKCFYKIFVIMPNYGYSLAFTNKHQH
jgi:hypothetical protein